MPHTRSAAKYLRKTEKRRLRNRSVKKGIKTQIKKFMEVAKSGNRDAPEEAALPQKEEPAAGRDPEALAAEPAAHLPPTIDAPAAVQDPGSAAPAPVASPPAPEPLRSVGGMGIWRPQ